MRMADTALDDLANQGDTADASSDPVPEVEFNEEEVLRTCSDFIKVIQGDTSGCYPSSEKRKTKAAF